jgi:hypothetical protein
MGDNASSFLSRLEYPNSQAFSRGHRTRSGITTNTSRVKSTIGEELTHPPDTGTSLFSCRTTILYGDPRRGYPLTRARPPANEEGTSGCSRSYTTILARTLSFSAPFRDFTNGAWDLHSTMCPEPFPVRSTKL